MDGRKSLPSFDGDAVLIDPHSSAASKETIRRDVLAARRALADRGQRSQVIGDRFLQAFPLEDLRHPLVYVSVRDEVATIRLLESCLIQFREVVVPYCLPDYQLALFPLREMTELRSGKYGILEPDEQLRAERTVDPQSIDLAVVPGVAFDRKGNRLGYGKGYFDRLLARLPPNCPRVALAFDCQLVDTIPAEAHDIPLQTIVTETRTIDCQSL